MTTRTEPGGPDETSEAASWTVKVRKGIVGLVPEGQALPDRQPVYVHSWIYVFGVATLAALAVVIVTGGILAIGGVAWWHVSSLGLFVNSLHLWSVELFFGFMVIHLWGKFWMAAWRGGRALTWITGMVLFLASIGTAFTGYLSQGNFASQWISAEAKDGINSIGVGAFFNVLNPDAPVARGAAALRRGRHHCDARHPGPAPWRRATDRRNGPFQLHGGMRHDDSASGTSYRIRPT